jgi:membrane associated rhomboid family serine protease
MVTRPAECDWARDMGIYDRDYIRHAPRGGFGTLGAWSITTWLIVINIALFFVDGAMSRSHRAQPPLQRAGYFSIDKAVKHGQVWRIVTFQFVHASPYHLAVNMLGLFLFGSIVEAHFGARRYLAYYLLCGAAGAVMYVLLWATRFLVTDGAMPLIGASAGVMGVLVGAATFAPDMEVFVFIMPIKIRVLAWLMLGLAAYSVLANGVNAGGEAAHLGGGLLGLGLVRRQDLLNFTVPARRSTNSARPLTRRRPNRIQKDWSKDFNR